MGSLPYWYTGYTQYPPAKLIIFFIYICTWIKKNSYESWGQPMLRRRKAKTADRENSKVSFRSGSRSPNIRLFEKKNSFPLYFGRKSYIQTAKSGFWGNFSFVTLTRNTHSESEEKATLVWSCLAWSIITLDRSIYCCKRLLKFYLIFICKYFRHKAVSSTDNKI